MKRAIALGLSTCVLLSTSGYSLESAPHDALDEPAWSVNDVGTIYYYNYCSGTGIRWVFDARDRVGVGFDAGGSDAHLLESSVYFAGGNCTAYGFVELSTLSVYEASESGDLVGERLAEAIIAPGWSNTWCDPFGCCGWVPISWDDLIVPDRFAIVYTKGFIWYGPYQERVWSDDPFAGVCRPDTVPHTFTYGTTELPESAEPLLEEHGLPVELLLRARVNLPVGVGESVAQSTWGRLKAMYR